jgi:hypothetical protein
MNGQNKNIKGKLKRLELKLLSAKELKNIMFKLAKEKTLFSYLPKDIINEICIYA